MEAYESKSVYNGNLKLQGSNDGESYTDILTVGHEIHEGWNYYKLEEELAASDYPPQYREYRLFNAENDGCDMIGEVTFIGQKAFDDTTVSAQCDIVVSGDNFA